MKARRSVRAAVNDLSAKLINKYIENYRPIPGGYQQDSSPGFDPDHILGTTTAPFYNNNTGTRHMVTAGHNFDRPSNSRTYKNIHQPGKGYFGDNHVGTRYDHIFTYTTDSGGFIEEVHGDVGVWEPESEWNLTNKLAKDGGGTRRTIAGIVTWDWVKSNGGNKDYTMAKQGIKTGVTEGYIDNIDNTDNRFQTTADGDSGDPGGPFYHVDSAGDALVAGVVSTALDSGTRAGGSSIS